MRAWPRWLRWSLLVTDLGFVAYWTVAALHLIPPDWLYRNADNPLLVAWNWSFAPLDLLASGLGLLALRLRQKADRRAETALQLALTFCAGFMALAFWTIRADFSPMWWGPNLFLTVFPVIALVCLANAAAPEQAMPDSRG